MSWSSLMCRQLEVMYWFFLQAEDGMRDLVRSRGRGDVYKRQALSGAGDDGNLVFESFHGGL